MMKIDCGCDSLPGVWWSNSNCGWRVPSLRSTVPYFLLLVHVLWQVMMYYLFICLCFDTVGWASERASGLLKNWVMRCWCGYLSEARCKWSAYGPADATATPSSLASLKFRMVFTFLVPAYPSCPEKEAVKWVSVCFYFIYNYLQTVVFFI